MGPLANERRVPALEGLIGDAVRDGAEVRSGGGRVGNKGHFFEPTVVTGVDSSMRMMNEEPFGPLAMVMPLADLDEAVEEAKRLPYGRAAYADTRSAKTAQAVAERVETGMMTPNHLGLALPEVPLGRVKGSGSGSGGGLEAIEACPQPKFVTQAGL